MELQLTGNSHNTFSFWPIKKQSHPRETFEFSDLGLITSSKSSWNAHVDKITSKANKILKRTCKGMKDITTLRTVFLVLVKWFQSIFRECSTTLGEIGAIQFEKSLDQIIVLLPTDLLGGGGGGRLYEWITAAKLQVIATARI